MPPSWRHPYERIGVSAYGRLDTGGVSQGEKKQLAIA
jgi:hypothetical protein